MKQILTTPLPSEACQGGPGHFAGNGKNKYCLRHTSGRDTAEPTVCLRQFPLDESVKFLYHQSYREPKWKNSKVTPTNKLPFRPMIASDEIRYIWRQGGDQRKWCPAHPGTGMYF